MSRSERPLSPPTNGIAAPLDRVVVAIRGSAGTNLFGLLLLLLGLFAVFTVLLPGKFLQTGTMQSMMFQLPELGLLSLAMAIPLVSGGLNLAIIATTNAAALLMAWILTTQMPADSTGGELGAWIAIALVAGFLLCLLIGLITGFIVAVVGVHPILVTLGTQTLIAGVSIWLTRGRTLAGFPHALTRVSNETVAGIPISFGIFAVAAFAVHVLLTRSVFGIRIHMIGSNLESTRYSGVDTRRVQIWVYVLSSLLCWLAAIVLMARFNSAGADIAKSYLLITILAAILGGIDPYGGFGRVTGLVVALVILQTISSGFNLLEISRREYLTLALWGSTLIAVMAAKRLTGVFVSRNRSRASLGAPSAVTLSPTSAAPEPATPGGPARDDT
jgi:simple sugar transport system permease protein